MAAYVRALGSNWPNGMASSVAGGRLGSRVDGNLSEALTLAQVFLPGTPLILAGDEIGADGAVTEALDWSVVDGQRADPASRLGVFKAALDLRKVRRLFLLLFSFLFSLSSWLLECDFPVQNYAELNLIPILTHSNP